ncbi:MAG: galactosyltransferase-related protein, partial [Chitinophagaceae bacterium]
DGDVILHKHFVADHLRMAKSGTFVSGSRVLITPEYTQKVIKEKHFEKPSFFSKNIYKRYNSIHNDFFSAINYQMQRGKEQYKYVLGANMAFYKEDLIRVNGYDENFSGWGKEDNNIAIRLCNDGVAIRFLKFGGIVYHLHHAGEKNNNIDDNEILLQDAIRSNTTFVSNGLNAYNLK